MIPAMPTIIRYGMAVVALAISAWFALAWHQAQQTGRAATLIGDARLSPHQARRARAALSAAGTLNPDLTVDILRGQLAIDQGDYRSALRILGSVTAREPLDLSAWAELGVAAVKAGDSRLLATAGRHIAILIPRVK